jgi:hypothetical protein
MEGLDHDDYIWLRNTEFLAYTQGHRASIFYRPDKNGTTSYVILDGRHSKEVKEDGTIIITDHYGTKDGKIVYVCNKETGLRFIEAPNGELYEPDCYYHTDKTTVE